MQVILTIFPAVRMGLSCTWKQLFAVASATEVKYRSFGQKKNVLQSAYTSAIVRLFLKWLRRFKALLLSCDNVLKFDWYCQLSGSGNNSLNSQNLLDRRPGNEATYVRIAPNYDNYVSKWVSNGLYYEFTLIFSKTTKEDVNHLNLAVLLT